MKKQWRSQRVFGHDAARWLERMTAPHKQAMAEHIPPGRRISTPAGARAVRHGTMWGRRRAVQRLRGTPAQGERGLHGFDRLGRQT
ncbi:hypothetical protein ACLQ18_36550 [Streptomyces sp. DT193]|uniref:hypothetical protein n=1 Tax=Streptomyces sp. DT193 TaxID=3393418 RepID=UPI003CF27446